MKKAFPVLLVAVVLLGLGLYLSRTGPGGSGVSAEEVPGDPDDPLSVLGNLPLDLDGRVHRLKEGRVMENLPDCRVAWNTGLTQYMAAGDLNGDGVDDAAAIFVHECPGSVAKYYLGAAIRKKNGRARATNTIYLGDPIMVEDLKIDGGRIETYFLTVPKDKAWTDTPSVVHDLRFVVEGTVLRLHEDVPTSEEE